MNKLKQHQTTYCTVGLKLATHSRNRLYMHVCTQGSLRLAVLLNVSKCL